jgi:predicted DCC family thiol-disulfide oxidoreductase YuxK
MGTDTGRYTVLYDGGCPMCRRTVRVLRRLDWLGRLTFMDATDAAVRERIAPGLTEAQVLVEMYVVSDTGALAGGFAGYLWIARAVPVLWPMAVLGPVPGIRHLGDAVYRAIAANRVRRGRCTDEVCAAVTTPGTRS